MNGASFFYIVHFLSYRAQLVLREIYEERSMNIGGFNIDTYYGNCIPWICATLGTDEILVLWLWGGFCVDNATLTRFYSLHFLIPFAVAAFSMVHILLLHHKGSNNPLGLSS